MLWMERAVYRCFLSRCVFAVNFERCTHLRMSHRRLRQESDGVAESIPESQVTGLAIGALSVKGSSPDVGPSIVDVLYGYCYVSRLYNGGWRSDPEEVWYLRVS
jgi:hypothetical protein